GGGGGGEPGAGSGDQDRANAGVLGDGPDRGEQVNRELVVPGVPGLGTVELDLRGTTAAEEVDGLVLVSQLVVTHSVTLTEHYSGALLCILWHRGASRILWSITLERYSRHDDAERHPPPGP